MLVLALRTDKPQAEIGLYDGAKQLEYETWEAHRQLAETLHKNIQKLFDKAAKQLSDTKGIVVYRGPGSFTGLRIGLSVANALAYSLDCQIIAGEADSWKEDGIAKLQNGNTDKIALPNYGAPIHITKQKK